MVGEAEAMTTFDQIDELARWLHRLKDPAGVWAAEDERTRLYWRREAQRRLAAVCEPSPNGTPLDLPDSAGGYPEPLS